MQTEIILNDRNAIYHLNLLENELANTIITVGDPQRVAEVSKYFDAILNVQEHREFVTHTGIFKAKKISVCSTGMGVSNIEIFMNEVHLLKNFNLNTKEKNKKPTQCTFIRLGTSSAIHPAIAVDTLLINHAAIAFDNMSDFYNFELLPSDLSQLLLAYNIKKAYYFAKANEELLLQFSSIDLGITLTQPGFYAPQYREFGLPQDEKWKLLHRELYEGRPFTNMEMETAALYAFSTLLGHRAISINAILANRISNEFSKTPKLTIEKMIKTSLALL